MQTDLMHESVERLYKAASLLKGLEGQSAIAISLQQSPQTIYNWSKRGVSSEGALLVEKMWGVAPGWLLRGEGTMTGGLLSTPYSSEHATATSDTMKTLWPVSTSRIRPVWVVGRGAGGSMPERIWTDAEYPVGVTDDYSEVATNDPLAFLIEVVGTSMVPRYNPGEFALVEPGTNPDIDDDVLVRLKNGETILKRLVSRSGGYRLGSYNNGEILLFDPTAVSWVYYVAHPVPRRKIKSRM